MNEQPFKADRIELSAGPIHFREAGEGEPIVFVHGLVGDFTHFEHVARRLVDSGRRVIGIDLPGCGASHKRRERHDLNGYARDVLTLLDELDVPSAVLAGHSAGGAIVTEAALRAPGRVSKLVLFSSAGLRRYPVATHTAARAVLRPWLLERSLDRLAMPLLDLVMKDKNQYTQKFIADALDRPKQPASAEMARVMSDLVPDLIQASVLDRAHNLRMPVLLMWGDTDRLIPRESADLLARRLVNGRLVKLPGCGHMPMIERPEVVTDELERFLGPVALPQRRAA
jgi:pimeloyl-ACP methyl ester carboxylesterase